VAVWSNIKVLLVRAWASHIIQETSTEFSSHPKRVLVKPFYKAIQPHASSLYD